VIIIPKKQNKSDIKIKRTGSRCTLKYFEAKNIERNINKQ